MFKYADNCTESLMLSRTAFFALYDNYNKLEDEAIVQRDSASQAKFERNNAIAKVAEVTDKKRKWGKVAIGEAFIIVGAVAGVITGAWLPVLAIVTIAEVAIIMNFNPPGMNLKMPKPRLKL